MKKCVVEKVDEISEEIEKKMRDDLISYEASHGIDVNYKRFSLVLKNELQGIIGVLNAYTAFSEIYIDDMWVESSYRGNGYGKQLILALENSFKGKGFNNINLVTSAFQAPGFYKKMRLYRRIYARKQEKSKIKQNVFCEIF